MAKFYFKPGKREEGFSELDLVVNKMARNSKGFRGFVSLLSRHDSNVAVIMTLWEDEETLLSSEKSVFFKGVEKIERFLDDKPTVEHFRVFSTELLMLEGSQSSNAFL